MPRLPKRVAKIPAAYCRHRHTASVLNAAGAVAQLEFLRPITASILSERRAVAPFGLAGGGPAGKGMNLILRRDGRRVNMGAKATAPLQVCGHAVCALLRAKAPTASSIAAVEVSGLSFGQQNL